MVKKHMKSSDGLYHVKGHSYPHLEGSRAQVWHQTAHKTSGGLVKHDLMMNKNGRIVSRKKHATAKKEKRLEKAGYKTRKGEFGSFREGEGAPRRRSSGKRRSSRNKR